MDGLSGFGSSLIQDAQPKARAVDGVITPLDPAMAVSGPAFTVQTEPGDNLALHYAIRDAPGGSVLVVDAKGSVENGLWGDILTLAAEQAGLLGLIIDGAVRDATAIIARGFPVFARAISPQRPTKHGPGRLGPPILLANAPVACGDLVVGDRDGIVIVPLDAIDETIERARARAQVEERVRREIRQGRSTVEILDLPPLA